jgi:hypothetical protein
MGFLGGVQGFTHTRMTAHTTGVVRRQDAAVFEQIAALRH